MAEADKIATEMAMIHNMFIRSLNSIYLQAPNITDEKDGKELCGFASAWCQSLHGHHNTEEEIIFPSIEKQAGKPGLMSANVDQHKTFHDGVNALQSYVLDCVAGKVKYDGAKIRKLIDSFGAVMTQHLADEIPTLSSLKEYKIDWPTLNDVARKHATSYGDTNLSLPFFLTSWDKDFEGGIHGRLPFPWFIKLYIKWGLMGKYPGYWRFSACDTKGNPRQFLPFAKPEPASSAEVTATA